VTLFVQHPLAATETSHAARIGRCVDSEE
jgi:hypothetical protein